MRIKGIVKRYDGFLGRHESITINLKPKTRITIDPETKKEKTMAMWDNKRFPKVNSIVRINFRAKDMES